MSLEYSQKKNITYKLFMIELYIENKKIDLTEDIEINFTYETIDPDKLASIKNSFSKTVNIPGTANNNITFGHLFRFDKYIPSSGPSNIGNSFDPHKRVKWFINKNGSLVNRGYCVLDNILMKSERDITYQLTLYGGLGEFFYSLLYNEDGSAKNLSDMFWNWFPKLALVGHGNALDPGEEDTQTLYKASADIVASSYHSLNPLYTYEGTTDISKDVVFVPCYTGIYEDFDSKHMLVSTFNQNYYSSTPYVSNNKKAVLSRVFPDSFTDTDGTVYTTLDKNFSQSSAYKYGIVTFSRDIDPWEAGDIRVNELPVAIRLSKLMHAISQPENNGGYEVIWDDEIKQSLHWLYGWVLLGKLKQEKEYLDPIVISKNTTYDGQTDTLDWNAVSGDVVSVAAPVEYNLSLNSTNLSNGKYNLTLNVYPSCSFETYAFDRNIERYDLVSSSFSSNVYQPGHGQHPIEYYRVYNTVSVLIHKIYDGSTFIKGIADLFYFTTSNDYSFPAKQNGSETTAIKNKLSLQYFNGAGESLYEVTVHNCKLKNPEISGRLVSYVCDNDTISTNIDLASDASNLSITQHQCVVIVERSNTSPSPTCTILGEEPFSFGAATQNYETTKSIFGFIVGTNLTKWPYNYNYDSNNFSFRFSLNESKQNGFLVQKSSGFNIMNIDKKTLFANSKSPMSYLSGYCKLMNYKFVCDDTLQKIYIHTRKNYYKNRIIGLDDRVDIGRNINIKNLTTKNKRIIVGLYTPETYPVNLFNKNSKEKFNTYRYETGIKFYAGETNLLDNLIFKNAIDWQQSSIFYNLWPQIPRPYAQTTVSWTLFDPNSASTEGIKTKEIFTPGVQNTTENLFAGVDFLPKMSLFDKDNKFVDMESTLIFLNGFVKNYDYTRMQSEDGAYWVISPKVMLSNDTYEQYYLNQSRCYLYDFKYNDTFVSWGEYSNDQKGSATSWSIPMFSRDLYNYYDASSQTWNLASSKLASWNLVNQEGLDKMYNLFSSQAGYDDPNDPLTPKNTMFLKNPDFIYSKTTNSIDFLGNEYIIESVPVDDELTERIYDKNWKDYMGDLYDRNARDITAYIDLSGLGDATEIMRNIYSYKSHLWVITKIENFKIAETIHDKFTKVTMHKINKLSTWTN